MTTTRQWRGVALALLLTASPAAAADTGAADCTAPDELLRGSYPLPALAHKVATRHAIAVTVVGSASSAASAAKGIVVYPARLGDELEKRLPGIAVTVVNRAGPGHTAQNVADGLPGSVAGADLVIWEAGTTDAVTGADLDAFGHALETGLAALRDAGIAAVLVDPQYSPQTATLYNFQPYVDYLRQIADVADVNVLRRYDLMRHYEETGRFTPSATHPADHLKNANFVHACLAQALAGVVVTAMTPADAP